MNDTITVILCGVGGQGTILAADILAKTAAASGLDVKLSEIHGMAQRGGSVTTIVRFGSEVHAPVADPGTADVLVAFEIIEALRSIHMLKPAGRALVNDERQEPLSVKIGASQPDERIKERLAQHHTEYIPARTLAEAAGTAKATNVVLLGALSRALPFAQETWEDVISKRVPPKTLDINIAAFRAGRHAVEEG